LVTAPSNSPENFPLYPGNGRYFDETSGLFLKGRMMQAGPTMDNQIVTAVFDAFLGASNLLGQDHELQSVIEGQRDRLPPMQIGRRGQLQEWLDDWDDLEPEHRHVSHLWGAYPGDHVTPLGTPDLAAAVAVTLEGRGIGGCGWSYAHKAGVWARLGNAERADEQLTSYLSGNVLSNLFSRCGQAMQVDGTLGMTAAIGEMLLQSHDGRIDLLPALPDSWADGRVMGLRARGGVDVGLAWSAGEATEVILRPRYDGRIVLRNAPTDRVTRDGMNFEARTTADGDISFEAEAGREYHFQRR
jgi:alpha-L-fucosidase 2